MPKFIGLEWMTCATSRPCFAEMLSNSFRRFRSGCCVAIKYQTNNVKRIIRIVMIHGVARCHIHMISRRLICHGLRNGVVCVRLWGALLLCSEFMS